MFATAAAAALGWAVVTQDATALRAAPAASGTVQAQLWPGDLVEVRGERLDFLQVYDHARERAGYLRPAQLRPLATAPADAPALLAVLRFLREQPGAESLGIAYAAAYLKAVPAAALDAEPFDALGVMAERLARRASSRAGRGSDSVAGQLETAGRYGVKFTSFERDGALQLCYEGDAFRRVLAMKADAAQQARAVLALTRHDCIDPALPPHRKPGLDQWRADLLDRIAPAAAADLPETAKHRLRARRAGVWAALAFARSRDGGDAAGAGRRALDELAAIDKAAVADDDMAEVAEAGLRAAAVRWAAEGALPAVPGPLALQLAPGAPGQTCLQLLDHRRADGAPLLKRCTYATVWPASLRVAPDQRMAVLAVQPLEGWTELWLLRAGESGWTVDVLPPAAAEPGLGTVEFAGWVPGAARLLVAREARVEGRLRRSFELLSLDTLQAEKTASSPQSLSAFARWQDARWRQQTLMLR